MLSLRGPERVILNIIFIMMQKVCEIQKARVWENDPELKTVNLNNILNIPQELLEELMEALEENVYVTELTLVNTGILDKGTVEIFKISFCNFGTSLLSRFSLNSIFNMKVSIYLNGLKSPPGWQKL